MFLERRTNLPTDLDQRIHRRIGRISVSLGSDLKQILEDFAAIYPLESPEEAAAQTIRIDVRRSGRSRTGRRLYRVYADGEEVGGWRTSNGVFPLVEWGVNLRIIVRRSEFVQLHAASMAYQNRGFIFAGNSGCGKSTLAAILLARGWQYLCDEFALVNIDTLRLEPFPKALCIKAGSFPVVRGLGLSFARRRDYIKEFKGRVGYINPHDAGPTAISAAVAARFIIFPKYQPGAKPRLQRITPAGAVFELSRCCFNRQRFPEAATPALVKLVGHAECFRLDVGGVTETSRLLESRFGHLRSLETATATAPQSVPSHPAPRRNGAGPLRTRREILRAGAKLVYVAPTVLTLSAREALAVASNPSGVCSTAVNTGGLCETDTDCCTRRCTLGICD